MISNKEAAAQVLRLSGLSDFPKIGAGVDELISSLQSNTRDREHAARVVTRWLDTNRFAPKPVDVRELAYQCDYENNPNKWKCAKCGGTGWVEAYELLTWNGGGRKDIESLTLERYQELLPKVPYEPGTQVLQKAVSNCSCKLGRLRAEDMARDQSERKAPSAA